MTPKKAFERFAEFIRLFHCDAEMQLGFRGTHQALATLSKISDVKMSKCPHCDLALDACGERWSDREIGGFTARCTRNEGHHGRHKGEAYKFGGLRKPIEW